MGQFGPQNLQNEEKMQGVGFHNSLGEGAGSIPAWPIPTIPERPICGPTPIAPPAASLSPIETLVIPVSLFSGAPGPQPVWAIPLFYPFYPYDEFLPLGSL